MWFSFPFSQSGNVFLVENFIIIKQCNCTIPKSFNLWNSLLYTTTFNSSTISFKSVFVRIANENSQTLANSEWYFWGKICCFLYRPKQLKCFIILTEHISLYIKEILALFSYAVVNKITKKKFKYFHRNSLVFFL